MARERAAPPLPTTTRELVMGRFEPIAQLGTGSFGQVTRCFDHETQREVALKELHRFGPDALLSFKREFRSLTDVQHPNLVRLFELFENDERRWAFSMELVPGTDFLSWVRSGQEACGYDERRLRDSLLQLTQGLSALHGLGMLHRDVKPENIRVTAEGRVVLLDFGLVTYLQDERQTSEPSGEGTAAYMAPEQASQRVGPEADFYAVGVLLYEALTGSLPFNGSAIAILMDKSARPPRPPRELNPHVSPQLEQLCLQLLEREVGQRAGADDVLCELGVAAATSLPPALTSGTHPVPKLVGREREVATLRDEWHEARECGLRVVLLEGASGIGKTALADAALSNLAQTYPDLLVLRGRCHASEQVRYKVWDGVVDTLCTYLLNLTPAECASLIPAQAEHLSVLFPVLSRVQGLPKAAPTRVRTEAGAQRFAMFEQFGELLSRLAHRRAIVICVDDLQWGDADSLALLQVLLSLAEKPKLLFLATVRPLDEIEPDLAQKLEALVKSSPRCMRVSVSTLDQAASLQLSAHLLRLPPDHEDVVRVAQDSGGNPWCAVQMAQSLADVDDSPVPPSDLDATLRRRAGRLGPDAQRVMELLAVAGGPQPSPVIRRALGMDGAAFEHAISALRVHMLARAVTRGAWVCYHDRVREAVSAGLFGALRQSIHAQLAQAWQREGGSPERIAAHFRAADEPLLALPWLERAADAAEQTGAYGQAAALYREALSIREQAGETASTLEELMLKLAHALACAGRGAESARMLLAARETANEADRATLQVRAAEQLLRAGQVQEGVEAARVAFESLELDWPKSPTRALLRILFERLVLRVRGYEARLRPDSLTRLEQARLDALVRLGQPLSWADLLRATELSVRYLRAALDGGDPEHVARALLLEGMMASMHDPDQPLGRELLAQADALVQRSGSASLTGLSHFAHGTALMSWGDGVGAAARLRAAQVTYETHCASETWQLANVRSVYLPARFLVGDHRGFFADAERWTSEALLRGDTFAFTACVVTGAGYTRHLMMDAPARALDEIDDAMENWEGETFGLQQCFALVARQMVRCYMGGVDGLQTIEKDWPRARRSVLWRLGITREILLVYRAAAALTACVAERENPQLRRVLRSACDALKRPCSHFGRSSGQLLLAQKAWLDGDVAGAIGLATAAQREWARAGYYTHRHAELMIALCTRAFDATQQAQTFAAWLRSQGWNNPEQAIQMSLPIYPLLKVHA